MGIGHDPLAEKHVLLMRKGRPPGLWGVRADAVAVQQLAGAVLDGVRDKVPVVADGRDVLSRPVGDEDVCVLLERL